MAGLTFTPAADADPGLVAAYQAGLAKLRPSCTQCGRTLTGAELESRRCGNRADCTLRQIFAGPKFAGGKGLCLGEVHALQRYRRAKNGLPVEPARARPAGPSAVEVAESILAKRRGPMRVVELAKLTAAAAPGLKGKTPTATVSAQVYVAARAGKRFRLVDRGVVDLLDRPPAARARGGRRRAVAKGGK